MLKKFWNNKDKRKGVLGSVIFHTCLLLLFLFMGLTYYEPKPEDGILINFGNSEAGMGNKADGAQAKVETTTPQKVQQQQNTQIAEEEIQPMQTQNTVGAPEVNTSTPKTSKPTEKEKPTEEKVEEKPKPSSELSKLLNNVKNTKAGGEGEKQGSGDQGAPDGSPDSKNRTGGGSGNSGSGNYMLGNRQALSKPKPEYACAEQGRVVVKIYVDRDGKVSRAVPGEKIAGGAASTTTSACLYEKAKSAAMRTHWQADADAPVLQTGYIIYNFFKN